MYKMFLQAHKTRYNMFTTWQKIATAPKDGTKFVAYDPMADAAVIIRWQGGDFPGQWVITWTGEPNPDCTYWLPLPPLPDEA